jgi:hypothetical protein
MHGAVDLYANKLGPTPNMNSIGLSGETTSAHGRVNACADLESAPVIYLSDKSIRFHISRRERLSIHDDALKHNIL